MILGSHVKKAQTISFVECGFERLGLGHRTVVRVGSGQWISSEESGELYALLILLVFRTPWLGGRVVLPPFSHCLSYPFIRAFTLLPVSTCKLNFLGLKTCPISPYLEWLGVVVKAEEHGSVRCRVLNDSNGNFPFVLGRYIIQRLLLYWHRYFRFFPKLFLYCFCPFFQGDLGYAEDRIILGYVSRLFGLLLHILGYTLSRLGPWAPM